jgi:hypothetical protein
MLKELGIFQVSGNGSLCYKDITKRSLWNFSFELLVIEGPGSSTLCGNVECPFPDC